MCAKTVLSMAHDRAVDMVVHLQQVYNYVAHTDLYNYVFLIPQERMCSPVLWVAPLDSRRSPVNIVFQSLKYMKNLPYILVSMRGQHGVNAFLEKEDVSLWEEDWHCIVELNQSNEAVGFKQVNHLSSSVFSVQYSESMDIWGKEIRRYYVGMCAELAKKVRCWTIAVNTVRPSISAILAKGVPSLVKDAFINIANAHAEQFAQRLVTFSNSLHYRLNADHSVALSQKGYCSHCEKVKLSCTYFKSIGKYLCEQCEKQVRSVSVSNEVGPLSFRFSKDRLMKQRALTKISTDRTACPSCGANRPHVEVKMPGYNMRCAQCGTTWNVVNLMKVYTTAFGHKGRVRLLRQTAPDKQCAECLVETPFLFNATTVDGEKRFLCEDCLALALDYHFSGAMSPIVGVEMPPNY